MHFDTVHLPCSFAIFGGNASCQTLVTAAGRSTRWDATSFNSFISAKQLLRSVGRGSPSSYLKRGSVRFSADRFCGFGFGFERVWPQVNKFRDWRSAPSGECDRNYNPFFSSRPSRRESASFSVAFVDFSTGSPRRRYRTRNFTVSSENSSTGSRIRRHRAPITRSSDGRMTFLIRSAPSSDDKISTLQLDFVRCFFDLAGFYRALPGCLGCRGFHVASNGVDMRANE